MPTLKNSGASLLDSAGQTARKSDTLAKEALANVKKSLSAIPTHSANGMTKDEALAVAWTGIEALANMKQAKLYRSKRQGCVVIQLLATELTLANGLKALADK